MIYIEKFVNGKWLENCYAVHDAAGHCVIIDPGSSPERIAGFVEDKQLRPLAILNTHAHYDHIGAVEALKRKFGTPFYLHSKDRALLSHANLYRALFDGDALISLPSVDRFVDRIETPIRKGELSIDVLWTPGHTPGGVCFLIEDALFSGDTLLHQKIGRVDLPGGDREALYVSLRKLKRLPPETRVYPGHGDTTTLGDELKHNRAFLRALQ